MKRTNLVGDPGRSDQAHKDDEAPSAVLPGTGEVAAPLMTGGDADDGYLPL